VAISRMSIMAKPDMGDLKAKNIGVHRKISTRIRNQSPKNRRSPISSSLPSESPIHIYIIPQAMGKSEFEGVMLGLSSSGYHSIRASL
jgi:hypothetical protein